MRLLKRIPSDLQYGFYEIESDNVQELFETSKLIENQIAKDKEARQSKLNPVKVIDEIPWPKQEEVMKRQWARFQCDGAGEAVL